MSSSALHCARASLKRNLGRIAGSRRLVFVSSAMPETIGLLFAVFTAASILITPFRAIEASVFAFYSPYAFSLQCISSVKPQNLVVYPNDITSALCFTRLPFRKPPEMMLEHEYY